jgi:alpha-beta hydrolase superfamily lysophospholipase
MAPSQSAQPWLPNLLAQVALSTGVGYLAAAYTVSRWLTRPTRGRPQETPDRLGLPWERIECHTADGFRLRGWVVQPARPRGTVAVFHGIRRNRSSTLGRMALLAAEGYRCVAFDHRAHGESAGRRSSFGYHEGRDVAAVLDLARRTWPHEPLAALGISMGAAAICYAAEHTSNCAAIVLESCYHDIASAFENRLRHGYPPWYQRLSRGVIWVTERRLGLRLGQLSPADHIERLAPAPVLLLTGTEDRHATPQETVRLYERCREPKEIWMVPGATHKDVLEAGGPAYRQRVLSFLDNKMAA